MTTRQVNWKSILPAHASVCYENPAFGDHKPWLYEDFLLVSFPNDEHVELQWDDEVAKYSVSLTAQRWGSVLERRWCKTVEDAIAAVVELSWRTVPLNEVPA